MPTVVNRQTFEVKMSVNIPDYPYAQWVGGWDSGAPTAEPDLSAVAGEPKKYWILTGDVFTVMDAAAKQLVEDEAEAQADADEEEKAQSLSGATVINNKVDDVDELVTPPPGVGLTVFVDDIDGSGEAGIAISTEDGWALFQQTGEI